MKCCSLLLILCLKRLPNQHLSCRPVAHAEDVDAALKLINVSALNVVNIFLFFFTGRRTDACHFVNDGEVDIHTLVDVFRVEPGGSMMVPAMDNFREP